MTHPTEQQLLAWLDGEVDSAARGDEVAAHVEGCARCQQVIDGTQHLGAALRLWAEDCAPAPADDLADRILRVVAADTAGGTTAAAGTSAPAVPSQTSSQGATVTVLPVHRRWGWAALSTAIAAAAVAVFALVQHARPGRGAYGPSSTELARLLDATATPGGPRGAVAEHGGESSSDLGGSEVLAIDSDEGDDNSTISVMEVEGEREGATVAVVWIDDELENEPAEGSTAIQ